MGDRTSPQGPVYLGYRLGHIKGDSRVFRALVYNKGAMVLHMLRRLIGDDAFFRGLRELLRDVALQEGGHRRLPRGDGEAASGQSLERFFERWIFGTDLPSLRFTSRVDAAGVHVALRSAQRRHLRRSRHGHDHLRGRLDGGRRRRCDATERTERVIPLKADVRERGREPGRGCVSPMIR